MQRRSICTNICQIIVPCIFISIVGVLQIEITTLLSENNIRLPGSELLSFPKCKRKTLTWILLFCVCFFDCLPFLFEWCFFILVCFSCSAVNYPAPCNYTMPYKHPDYCSPFFPPIPRILAEQIPTIAKRLGVRIQAQFVLFNLPQFYFIR